MPFPLTEDFDSIEDIIKASIEIEVYDIVFDRMVKHLKENYTPEDIFDDSQLEEWAEENGYIKEETDATKE